MLDMRIVGTFVPILRDRNYGRQAGLLKFLHYIGRGALIQYNEVFNASFWHIVLYPFSLFHRYIQSESKNRRLI